MNPHVQYYAVDSGRDRWLPLATRAMAHGEGEGEDGTHISCLEEGRSERGRKWTARAGGYRHIKGVCD